MGAVPEAYYQFVMDYAPYVYVIPPGTPDPELGRATFAAAFAIDFLYEVHSSPQFEARSPQITSKISDLASFILTQQCTDPTKLACGGFRSTEASASYYSVDACRAIPSLLKAHELTGASEFLNAARLAGATFLYNMQHKPSQLGVHDKYYGGFARAVTLADSWLQQMDVEALYGLAGLKMLCERDSGNKATYEAMMADAVGFCRSGVEQLFLYYDPPPTGDGDWHRAGIGENVVYDDSIAYALWGLHDYEGFSSMVQKTYNSLNTIRASAQHPAYNPAVCWAGYMDVISRCPACDYYDAVTAGILWKIRKGHDKPSLKLSTQVIDGHQDEFMFWGVKHADYSAVENRQAMATVCWLSRLYVNYEEPVTRFTQVLGASGEDVTLYPIREAADRTSYGEGFDVRAVVSPARVEEIIVESGYIINDYITLYTFIPLRVHDKIRRRGEDYEVQTVQAFDFSGETAHFKSACRRLVGQ